MTTSPALARLNDARISRARRRTPMTWIRGGGPANLLFLLPMLVIFGVFSWGPIVESVVMSVQHTNFVTAPTFVGADNFLALFRDPLVPIAVQNTAWFALLAVLFYDTGRWVAHGRAVSIVDSFNYRGAPAERVSVFPVRFTVLRWRAVVEGDGFIYEVPVDLSGDFDAAGGHTEYPAISSPAIDAARTTRTFQVFEKFDQLPFWTLLPVDDTVRVELLDLRFGTVQSPGFEAVAFVEPDHRINRVFFSFGAQARR